MKMYNIDLTFKYAKFVRMCVSLYICLNMCVCLDSEPSVWSGDAGWF